jgi:hypothetical protein
LSMQSMSKEWLGFRKLALRACFECNWPWSTRTTILFETWSLHQHMAFKHETIGLMLGPLHIWIAPKTWCFVVLALKPIVNLFDDSTGKQQPSQTTSKRRNGRLLKHITKETKSSFLVEDLIPSFKLHENPIKLWCLINSRDPDI